MKIEEMSFKVIKFEELLFPVSAWAQVSPIESLIGYAPRNGSSTLIVVRSSGMTEAYKLTSGDVVWVCGDLVHLPPSSLSEDAT